MCRREREPLNQSRDDGTESIGTITRIIDYEVRHEGCFILGEVVREKRIRRVVFTIEFDDSMKVVVDEVMDATSALLRAGDLVRVKLDDRHTETTVRPIANWSAVPDHGAGIAHGIIVREGQYFDAVGSLMRASLLQVEKLETLVMRTEVIELVVTPAPSATDDDNPGEQTGIVMDRFEYLHFTRKAFLPSWNLTVRRVAFRVLYFYRGYRVELITIDQPLTPVNTSLRVGDGVYVRLPDALNRQFGIRPIKSLTGKALVLIQSLYRRLS